LNNSDSLHSLFKPTEDKVEYDEQHSEEKRQLQGKQHFDNMLEVMATRKSNNKIPDVNSMLKNIVLVGHYNETEDDGEIYLSDD
jgi:hypothetical protein